MMRLLPCSLALLLTFFPLAWGAGPDLSSEVGSPNVVVWRLGQFGELRPGGLTFAGSPKVVDSPLGKAMYFDGVDDGLFIPSNPLDGLSEFTLEVVFCPDSDGPQAQRFVHFGHAQGGRVLLETRLTQDKQWYLDTFIMGGITSQALIDPRRLHPANRWHHVAYVVRGGHLSNYVNGVLELEAHIDVSPLHGGETSLGVRLNRESWFKGAIYSVRVTPKALAADAFTDLGAVRRNYSLQAPVY